MYVYDSKYSMIHNQMKTHRTLDGKRVGLFANSQFKTSETGRKITVVSMLTAPRSPGA
jgi:hypothetical protein